MAPLRACERMSLSPPSWLLAKIDSVILPSDSRAMREETSSRRWWKGCDSGLLCPILYSNSAARAARGSDAAAPSAATEPSSARRVTANPVPIAIFLPVCGLALGQVPLLSRSERLIRLRPASGDERSELAIESRRILQQR